MAAHLWAVGPCPRSRRPLSLADRCPRAGDGKAHQHGGARGSMTPFREWKPWQRTTTIVVAVLLGLYIVYALFVAIPNGHHDNVYLRLGTQGSTRRSEERR